jgi:hypothetical protein
MAHLKLKALPRGCGGYQLEDSYRRLSYGIFGFLAAFRAEAAMAVLSPGTGSRLILVFWEGVLVIGSVTDSFSCPP